MCILIENPRIEKRRLPAAIFSRQGGEEEITMLTRWHDDAAARRGGRSAAARAAASCQSSFVIRTGLRQWTTSVAENVISRCPRIPSASPWPARCRRRRSEITDTRMESLPRDPFLFLDPATRTLKFFPHAPTQMTSHNKFRPGIILGGMCKIYFARHVYLYRSRNLSE